MRKNLFVWIFLVFLSGTWIISYILFFADIDSYLLSLASSFKDDTRPASAKLRFVTTIWSNISNSRGIDKKSTIKTGQKRRIQINRKNRFSNHETVFLKRFSNDFKTNWCRIDEAKLDWKKYLAPCAGHTEWGIKHAGWRNKKMKTCAANSFISKWDIRPAGEFSRFFIQSRTSSNYTKKIGGDSWRIHIKGTSSVSVTVFDYNNGIYEAIFLLMEAGYYRIEIKLDYTLCDGFKDPPVDWYRKGSYQGKNQPDGILEGDRPYLMESFHDGKYISINVPQPKYSKKILFAMKKIRKKFFYGNKNNCDVSCSSLISNGLGRWINGKWKPLSQELRMKREPRDHKGMLWIYGDSVSKLFAEHLVNGPYHEICEKVFEQCKVTYSWVYNIKNIKNEENLDGNDYDHERVMGEINKVLDDKRLNKYSVITLNWGIHFAAAVNFTRYKKLIDDFLETLQAKRKKRKFKGEIIWRTTTAIFRERFPNPHKDVRRFLTFPRIILYNAYAMSAMCKAGVDVIDMYAMTDSFPPGTVSKRDPVHFEWRAMESVQALLYNKYAPLPR